MNKLCMLSLKLFLVSLVLLFSGCAYFPDLYPISETENQAVRHRFKEMVADQKNCHCCLDGAVKIRFENFFYTGSVAGYLQAMSSSYLKFMALSPLGQPLIVLTSDGESFQYVDVAKQTQYTGSVTGKTFQKYAPIGFSPEYAYYWFTGKLRPGDVSIALTSRAKDGDRYWIELYYDDGHKDMVLFDPVTLHIYHHLVYNGDDEVILEILYDNYGPKKCSLPRSITVTSLTMNSTLAMQLDDLVDKVSLSRGDFSYTVPPTFKQEVVE